MSDMAIRVDNLSKRYKIGTKHRYDTLRDQLANGLRAVFRRNGGPSSLDSRRSALSDTIWALKDVSFEVKQGQVVGIIGGNGAGKSTLLKILSRITEPTEGRAEIHGRVRSLLEVGTGFHAELTGRENIYLNGAVLGMKKDEIDHKFDAIVAFAEIEKFIDTPVKHYSSGMYVRLAFAVAAHLEPEILLVDEVLAVGDAVFQEKCLGVMQKTASSGNTVLFVSHNMTSIQHLCSRAILLQSGQVSADGLPEEVIKCYFSKFSAAVEGSSVHLRDWPDRVTTGQARIIRFEIADERGQLTTRVPFGSAVRFSIFAEFYRPFRNPCFGVLVHDAKSDPILDIQSSHAGLRMGHVDGNVIVEASVETLALYPGKYLLSPWITESAACNECLDWVKHCCTLRVDPAPGPHGDLRLDSAWGKYWIQSNWSMR